MSARRSVLSQLGSEALGVRIAKQERVEAMRRARQAGALGVLALLAGVFAAFVNVFAVPSMVATGLGALGWARAHTTLGSWRHRLPRWVPPVLYGMAGGGIGLGVCMLVVANWITSFPIPFLLGLDPW